MLHIIASVAMSLDGRIDSAGPDRLTLSNDQDWDAIDDLRASVDAILIGGQTARADNPSLRVKDLDRVAGRVADGRTPQPHRVVISASGNLDPDGKLFQIGSPPTIVCVSEAAALPDAISEHCDILRFPQATIEPEAVLKALSERGIERILIEGGAAIHTQFLSGGLVHELRVAIAPFFVGEPDAVPFVNPAAFCHRPDRPMRLGSLEKFGDMAVLTYLPETVSWLQNPQS